MKSRVMCQYHAPGSKTACPNLATVFYDDYDRTPICDECLGVRREDDDAWAREMDTEPPTYDDALWNSLASK